MTPEPLEQLDEDELLRRARAAMARATAQPAGSVARAIQWAAFDTAMAELGRRAIRFVLSRLGEFPDGTGLRAQLRATARAAVAWAALAGYELVTMTSMCDWTLTVVDAG